MQISRTGTNASGMRRYNERQILSAVRRMNGASKAELARATALSPQAVTRIVDDLETDGSLIQAGRRSGMIGQPAVLYRINCDRGFTLGVEVGRSGIVIVLLDFDGTCRREERVSVAFPSVAAVLDTLRNFASEHLTSLTGGDPSRFLGTGVAMPWFLGEWREELGVTRDQADEWRAPDVEQRLRTGVGGDLFIQNDGNAATLAHLLCGAGRDLDNFVCVNLSTFVGGGVALGGQILQGTHGNAGALASMPVCVQGERDYLIHTASLYTLETNATEAIQQRWLERCAEALSFAIIAVNSLLDLEAVIIDGALSEPMVTRLRALLADRLRSDVPADFFSPPIRIGAFGQAAAAVGAGLLPIHSNYSPDLTTLAKAPGELA